MKNISDCTDAMKPCRIPHFNHKGNHESRFFCKQSLFSLHRNIISTLNHISKNEIEYTCLNINYLINYFDGIGWQ